MLRVTDLDGNIPRAKYAKGDRSRWTAPCLMKYWNDTLNDSQHM